MKGTIIAHQPAYLKRYIGSPSITVLPNGYYVASHDIFGLGSSEWVNGETHIYLSIDRGQTWQFLSTVEGALWNNLFVHNDVLYLMGPDRHFGTVLIRKSNDNGKTWTKPTNEQNGLLLKGEFHTSAVPVVVHNGRIWRAMETAHGPVREWGKRLGAMVMSAAVDADLLNADSWICTSPLYYDSSYLGGHFNGWLEGNVLVSPSDEIWNILRVEDKSTLDEKVAVLKINTDGTQASFDAQSGFVPFPGGSKKFSIRYDDTTNRYWALSNVIPDKLIEHYQGKNPAILRNTLALIYSADLGTWSISHEVLHNPDESRYGFQYADWQFDGNDIIFVLRTAYDDGMGVPNRPQDSNFLTFHRIKNFRSE